MIKSGLLNKDDCKYYMEDLYRRAQIISDSWKLSKSNDNTYLVKKIVQLCEFRDDTDSIRCARVFQTDYLKDTGSANDVCNEMEANEIDDSEVSESNKKHALTFEYHLIYSESYSVPVLYFNVYKQDGSLLPLAKVWELVPVYYRERLDEDKWTFLTQTEHPYIGRPFYQLHPCHTDKLMSAVSSVNPPQNEGSNNYLITWLSCVGPVVLLKMPFEYVS